MPFHYWVAVIAMLSAVLLGAIIAAKFGWNAYLECKNQPDEYWGE